MVTAPPDNTAYIRFFECWKSFAKIHFCFLYKRQTDTNKKKTKVQHFEIKKNNRIPTFWSTASTAHLAQN